MGPHEDLLPRLQTTRTANLALATLLVLLGLSPLAGRAGTPAPIPVPGEFRVDGPRLVRPEPTSWVAQPAGALAFGSGREVIFGVTFDTAGGAGRYEAPAEVTGAGSLGNYLFLGLKDMGLGILDATDPENLRPVPPLSLPGSRFLPGADGTQLVVLSEGLGMFRFPLLSTHHGNPLSDAVPDFLPFRDEVFAMAVSGPRAFVALRKGGVMVVNLPEDGGWSTAGPIETPEPLRELAVSGDSLLAQGFSGALWAVHPESFFVELLAAEGLPPSDALFAAGRTLVSAGPSGLRSYWAGRGEATTVSVNVGNTFFNPQAITVAPGDTVRWNWVGGTHSSTSGSCSGGGCVPDGIWDSGTKSSGNFSHTFDSAGTFPYFCRPHQGAMTGTVAVLADPCTLQCGATATPSGGTAPLAVNFSGTAIPTNCAGAPTYAWDFGDGATASTPTADHTYDEGGTYSWTLTVTADGIPCTQGGTVVAAEPCTLNCTASTLPTVGLAPLTVSFSATAQQTFCPEFPTFIWDFGDGTTSTIPITTHTYDRVGTYAWTLTATAAGVTCVRIGEVSAVGSFPGDCDGSAGISIGEVQQSINMFLGLQAAGCGVDCSTDGVVSIGEVQKVINAFLGLPSSCG